jgi:hypothetical protein
MWPRGRCIFCLFFHVMSGPSECCLCGSDTSKNIVDDNAQWTITVPFVSGSGDSKIADLQMCVKHTRQAHIYIHTACLFHETSGHPDIHKDLAEKIAFETCGARFEYDTRLLDFFANYQVPPKEEHVFKMWTVSMGSHNMKWLPIFPQFSDEKGEMHENITQQHSSSPPTRVTLLKGGQDIPNAFLQMNVSLRDPRQCPPHRTIATLCELMSRFSVHYHNIDDLLGNNLKMPRRKHKRLLWQVNETVLIAPDKSAFHKRQHTHFFRLGQNLNLRVNDNTVEFETVLGTNPSEDTLCVLAQWTRLLSRKFTRRFARQISRDVLRKRLVYDICYGGGNGVKFIKDIENIRENFNKYGRIYFHVWY